MKIYTANEIFGNDNEMIRVSQKNNLNKEEPIHMHEFIELTYYLEGGAVHLINGKEFKVKRGDLLLLNAKQAHSHITVENMSYIHIFIRNEFMNSSILNSDNIVDLFLVSSLFDNFDDEESNLPVVTFSGCEMLEIEHLCKCMVDEFENKDTAYNGILEGYVKVLLSKVVRNIRRVKDKNWIGDIKTGMPDVIEYINNNYSKKITLKNFAKENFYTPTYFNQAFKECYGVSIKEYIIKKRVQEAIRLLDTTDMPVDKIAVEVGYDNKSHFYNLFKKYTGLTPAEFKKVDR